MNKEFDGQPARQVDGDEWEAYVEWLAGTFPAVFSEADAIHHWQHDHVSALAWQARAALAPAAVVADADVETTAQLIYTQWDALAGYVPWVKGGNSTQQDYARKLARDLFVRLNRRAIPVDLLERCAERLEYHMCSECKEATCCMPGTRAAAVELRALLGKDC